MSNNGSYDSFNNRLGYEEEPIPSDTNSPPKKPELLLNNNVSYRNVNAPKNNNNNSYEGEMIMGLIIENRYDEALYAACQIKDYKTIQDLFKINKNLNPNVYIGHNSNTSLYIALKDNDAKCVNMLFKFKGMDISRADHNSNTILHKCSIRLAQGPGRGAFGGQKIAELARDEDIQDVR